MVIISLFMLSNESCPPPQILTCDLRSVHPDINVCACVCVVSFLGVIALSLELENLVEGLKYLSLSRVSMTARGRVTHVTFLHSNL